VNPRNIRSLHWIKYNHKQRRDKIDFANMHYLANIYAVGQKECVILIENAFFSLVEGGASGPFPKLSSIPLPLCYPYGGTWCCSRLMHYTTNQKVAGSNPNEDVRFFSWPNPSICSMAPGLTQPLIGVDIRNLSVIKGQLMHRAHNLANLACEPII
jgi:hypothetical protein